MSTLFEEMEHVLESHLTTIDDGDREELAYFLHYLLEEKISKEKIKKVQNQESLRRQFLYEGSRYNISH